jgi:hypothetical protein
MGLLMGAIAGAAGAVEETTKYALRTMMDEEKAKRIAEYGSKLKSDEDLTTRARNKGDAADERTRVQTEAHGMADKRGGLLSQSATDAYNKLAETDPEGAKLGLEAVDAAKAGGAYAQEPTTRDMLLAQGDIKSIAAMDEKGSATETRLKIAELQQSAAFAKMDSQYQLGVMKLDAMLSKAEAAGKSPTQVQQIEYLIKNGMPRDDATKLVYHPEAKVGEYTTTATESFDDKGNKVVTTKKVKPGAEKSAPTSGRVRTFVPGKGFVDQQQ